VKNPGGSEGGLVFEGGVIAPPCRGVGATLPRPASLPAAIRLNDLRIVPCGIDQVQFPVLFARNGERDRVDFENRRDLGEFLTGSGCPCKQTWFSATDREMRVETLARL
jgi:hypothetical protein